MEQVTENGTWSSQDIATGGMGSSDLSIRVYGETAEEIEPVIEEVTSIMEQYDDLDEPETTISDRYNEYTLEIDKDQVTQYGLTTAQVGMALYSREDANALTTVRWKGRRWMLLLQQMKSNTMILTNCSQS